MLEKSNVNYTEFDFVLGDWFLVFVRVVGFFVSEPLFLPIRW